MAESNQIDRRGFVMVVLSLLGTIMAVVVGLPAIGYLISPATKVQKKEDWVSLGPLENYPIGVPTLYNFTRTTINGWEKTVNSYGVYVMRYTGNLDDITVFSNWCTHLSCRVTWQEDEQNYICPCHDGLFDVNGQVIAGPPPEPMWEHEYKVEEGILYIFVEG